MKIDQSPIYRKTIFPWYDSEVACVIVLAAMLLVLLFSIAGLIVSYETTEFKPYRWVAVLLSTLSTGVLLSTGYRLIRRYLRRYSK